MMNTLTYEELEALIASPSNSWELAEAYGEKMRRDADVATQRLAHQQYADRKALGINWWGERVHA